MREKKTNWPEEKVDTVVPFISGSREEEQNHLPLSQLLTYVKCKISKGLVAQWVCLGTMARAESVKSRPARQCSFFPPTEGARTAKTDLEWRR